MILMTILSGKGKTAHVVVVYHVTIVTIGHGLLKKFWPFGNRMRSTHCQRITEIPCSKYSWRRHNFIN